MRQDLTDITLIVDRSGSMDDCKYEAQKGINSFIEEQKKLPGNVLFSLLQFDTEHEYVFNAVPIAQVNEYILIPRGLTALLDAVGRVTVDIGKRLEAMKEEDRPGLVIVAIITDGQENSSHEYRKSTIKSMIEEQQNKYAWQFTFLGANQDAFKEAANIGITSAATYATQNIGNAYCSLSSNITRMRSAYNIGGQVINQYTEDEIKTMS